MSLRYLLGRLGQAVFVLWAVFTVSFFALILLGDPVVAMATGGGSSSADVSKGEIAKLRHQYGFDKPVLVQYGHRLWSLLQGHFGHSFQTGEAVTHMLGPALGQTAILAALALVVAMVIGVVLALVSVCARPRFLEQALLTFPPLMTSIPTFLSGLVFLELFSFHWHLVPAFGQHGLKTLVLPVVTLAIPIGAVIAQVLLRSLRTTLREPFTRTVIAKGAGPGRLYRSHALRNACIPAVTVAGLIAGQLLVGALVVETVFSRNGLGRVTTTAAQYADIYLLQTVVLLVAAVIIVCNLVVDLLYPVLDPRVSAAGASGSVR